MRRILLILMFIISHQSFSQTIKGTISDSLTGESLIGSIVLVKDQLRGTTTDISGNFEVKFKSPGFYNLEIKYFGYNSKLIGIN